MKNIFSFLFLTVSATAFAQDVGRLNDLLVIPGISGIKSLKFNEQGQVVLQEPQKILYSRFDPPSGKKETFISYRNKDLVENSDGAGLVLHYDHNTWLSATHIITATREPRYTTRINARRVTFDGDKIQSLGECYITPGGGTCLKVTPEDCRALAAAATPENFKKCNPDESYLRDFNEDVIQSGKNFYEKTVITDAWISKTREFTEQNKNHCLELCHELVPKIKAKGFKKATAASK